MATQLPAVAATSETADVLIEQILPATNNRKTKKKLHRRMGVDRSQFTDAGFNSRFWR